MRTRRNRSKIILAVIVAILATTVSYSMFSQMNRQVSEQAGLIKAMKAEQGDSTEAGKNAYLVATTDLAPGDIVADQDVEFQDFPMANSTAFGTRSEVINKVLLKGIKKGEVFTTAQIAKISNDSFSSDVSLRPGYRALTLPSDNFQGKSDKMTQGSVVDIYSSQSDSTWILPSAKILSFEKYQTSASTSSTPVNITNADSITFEINANKIPDFITNASKGKLMLVAKNPNDKQSGGYTKSYSGLGTISGYGSGNSIRMTSKKRNHYSSHGGALPNLPSSVPITNLSGLPQPISPTVTPQTSVEVIEANVKSKVNFN